MKSRIFSFIFLLLISLQITFAQSSKDYYKLYIEQYSHLAQEHQKKFNIPASITLAQGLIESGAGRSELAQKSNNHFGIKCHDWNGDRVFHDDDEKQECFRKYDKPEKSFEDHSLFLVNRPRYKDLFLLRPTDYIDWAHGLKKMGYATDPMYAFKLIDIIEKYELYSFDKAPDNKSEKTGIVSMDRKIYKNNGSKFMVSMAGDSFESISKASGISENKLRKYNDLGADADLEIGQIVYLKHKLKRVWIGRSVHVVQKGETMYSIAQQNGIQLISLYKINKLPFTYSAAIGQILKLR